MHQRISVVTRIKNFVSEDWIAEKIIEHGSKIYNYSTTKIVHWQT